MNYLISIFTSNKNQEETELSLPVIVHKKDKALPRCSYCGSLEHKITNCLDANKAVDDIRECCYQNPSDIKSALSKFSEQALKRYVTKNKIQASVRKNCYDYYKTKIMNIKDKAHYIELIVFYECVLPNHPEFINKKPLRGSKYGKTKTTNDQSSSMLPMLLAAGLAAEVTAAGVVAGRM